MLETVPVPLVRFDLKSESPFDLTEAISVTEWKGFAVGMTVDVNIARGTALGEIHTIWLGAKSHNDAHVVAFEVHVDNIQHYLTQRGVHHVVVDDLAHRLH